MEKKTARILLLGKTGVGKSSFINYFIGKDVAEVGIGKPLTQELKEYTIENSNINLNITDSKGLEVENSEKIKKDIIENIKKRNVNGRIFDWYHTIFYCFSLNNGRIEGYEILFLKELKKEISQNIHIILTNCDDPKGKEKQINEMKALLKEKLGEEVSIYEVCSVDITKRNGTKVKKYGKEKIIDGVFKLLWKDISLKVSRDFIKRNLNPEFDIFSKLVKNRIKYVIEDKVSIWNTFFEKIEQSFSKNLKSELEIELKKCFEQDFIPMFYSTVDKLEQELNSKLMEIQQFYSSYYNIVYNDNIVLPLLEDLPDKINDIERYIKNEFEKQLDDMSIWGQLLVPFYNILKPKKIRESLIKELNGYIDRLIEMVNKYNLEEEIYKEIYSALRSQDKNI